MAFKSKFNLSISSSYIYISLLYSVYKLTLSYSVPYLASFTYYITSSTFPPDDKCNSTVDTKFLANSDLSFIYNN